jgi:hypothetical protein
MARTGAAGLHPPPPLRRARPSHYQALLRMLAEGYNGRQGMRSATCTAMRSAAPCGRRGAN